jgi:hypothetical protein
MKFTVKRETVVVTSSSFKLDKKSMKEIINILLTYYDEDLSEVSTPAEFFEAIKLNRLESIVFDLLSNYYSGPKIDDMHDDYKDGEEYFVYLE